MSNLFELKPPRSVLDIISLILGAMVTNLGSLITISLVIPCISETSFGIGTSGLTSHVLDSLFPLGKTFSIEISTILSFEILIPVVSRSKKQIGFVSLIFI